MAKWSVEDSNKRGLLIAAVMAASVTIVVITNLVSGQALKSRYVTEKSLVLAGRGLQGLNILYFAAFVTSPLRFWFAGMVMGVSNGLTSVASTQLFSRLIPPIYKSEFFSLRSVNAKVLAWTGPLLFGLLNGLAGFELAVCSLAVYLAVGTGFLLCVDVEKGIEMALTAAA